MSTLFEDLNHSTSAMVQISDDKLVLFLNTPLGWTDWGLRIPYDPDKTLEQCFKEFEEDAIKKIKPNKYGVNQAIRSLGL
jgi:hypothetical protein